MRKIFLILVLLLGVKASFAQESVVAQEKEAIKWEMSFDEAIKRAKDENKPVLVFFTGSDWCPPCKQVDRELFHTNKFKEFSTKNLILYKADFPRNRYLVSSSAKKANRKLQFKYGINSFPTVVVMNADGDVLGKKKGAYMAASYYPFLEAILKNN